MINQKIYNKQNKGMQTMRTTSKPWAGLAKFIVSASLLTGVGISHAAEPVSVPPELATGDLQLVFGEGMDPTNLQAMVEETWAKSKALRAQALAGREAQDVAKVKSPDNWMAALKEKKWLPEANAYIRAYVPEVLKGGHSDLDASTMWYCYFGPGGKFPDRLEPETIALLKETMWHWAQYWLDPEGASEGMKGSFQRDMAKKLGGKPYELLPLDWSTPWSGNENIEIRYKLPHYLVLDALRKDPAYAKRRLGNKTVEEWFAIFKPHIIDLLRDRVMEGLWVESGSTYTEITYIQLVRLYNLAPDPEIRQMAKMVLDLVFIEDATLCVDNIRGGGRSRAYGASRGKHDGIKELVNGESAVDGRFSIEYEFSDYQAPEIAVVLHRAKGAAKPFTIYNRVPGEIRKELPIPVYVRDSRLINYVYRTPGYSLGCSLMNPDLTYHGTSNQERMSSLLFQSGQYIYVMPKNTTTKGRSGKAFWSIQHENVMMLQQFADSSRVEAIALSFSGGLNIVEREGWIFAAAESGYAAVRFIDPSAGAADASYKWDADFKLKKGVTPKDLRRVGPTGKFLPILIHAGDPARDGSFEQFQKTVQEGKITIDQAKSRIDYRPKDGAEITWFYNQNANPLELALVNGQPPNLSPALVFDGPFMKAKFGDPRVYVGAGPFRAVYDLEKLTVTESKK